ncbi:oleosin L-like [Coffea arabica]|uniref:Oleosin L-like n=1 Tax=Coffea arabica TaxID=13443 RepID=A0A6P6U3J5_COFAR|nr:oleosin 1-like isoform X1 [Coffea arabica]XP_027085079.1 oleosin 1-like isoform X1 [Coffea arabica]
MATRPDQLQAQRSSSQAVKTITAVAVGGSLTVLSGLIGLVLATPLLVVFGPVLVPAAVTIFLILAGFFICGGLGVTASFIFYWMFRYATGKHPIGADQLDRVREKIARASFIFYWMFRYATGKNPIGADQLNRAKEKIADAAKEMKDKAEQFGRQEAEEMKDKAEHFGQQVANEMKDKAEHLEEMKDKAENFGLQAAKEMKDKAENFGQQALQQIKGLRV